MFKCAGEKKLGVKSEKVQKKLKTRVETRLEKPGGQIRAYMCTKKKVGGKVKKKGETCD